MAQLTPEQQAAMRNPLVSSKFWTLVNQESGEQIRYDMGKVAPGLQGSILSFVANPPRTPAGHSRFLLTVASRQTGKSTVAALAGYSKIANSPGQYGAIMADKKDRANDLFNAINICHDGMPGPLRPDTSPTNEIRQITFSERNRIKTLSGGESHAGIGRAVDFLHISEAPFMPDLGGLWNGILPAMVNRKDVTCIIESTPARLTEPSTETFQNMARSARKGEGRWAFLFSPMFGSALNWRPWDYQHGRLEAQERQLLETYGDPRGPEFWSDPTRSNFTHLTYENLAFRREIMMMDDQVRKWPDLFRVFYPFDPYTCWVRAGGNAIPTASIDRMKARSGEGVDWTPGTRYVRYREPKPDAVYVIGVDPSGWKGRDDAAFQVLEVYGDRWYQAACFSTNTMSPDEVARKLLHEAHEYNNALVIIENTGVGWGTLTPLVNAENRGEIKNLHYETIGGLDKPGVPATGARIDKAFGELVEALNDHLVLYDKETQDQLYDYGRDKKLQTSEARDLLNPDKPMNGRRRKDHWDRTSALMWACYGARLLPVRFEARQDTVGDLLPQDTSFDELEREHQIEIVAALQTREKEARRQKRKEISQAELEKKHKNFPKVARKRQASEVRMARKAAGRRIKRKR